MAWRIGPGSGEYQSERERERLVLSLKERGYIRTGRVEKAMLSVPRERFLPKNMEHLAYVDSPQPIGYGQTISAPHMVAIMVELLELKGGERLLEIGTGSGYHAAVAAEVVGPQGKVISIEYVEELALRAERVLKELGYENVEVQVGDGGIGCEKGPFDGIWAACACPEIPREWTDILSEGGRLLVPVDAGWAQDLVVVRKIKGELIRESKMSVVFVPLLGKYGRKMR